MSDCWIRLRGIPDPQGLKEAILSALRDDSDCLDVNGEPGKFDALIPDSLKKRQAVLSLQGSESFNAVLGQDIRIVEWTP